jgi:hypothetical protein
LNSLLCREVGNKVEKCINTGWLLATVTTLCRFGATGYYWAFYQGATGPSGKVVHLLAKVSGDLHELPHCPEQCAAFCGVVLELFKVLPHAIQLRILPRPL